MSRVATDTIDPNASAKRNALLLAAAQAMGSSAPPIAISLGGLAGIYLLGDDKSLATAPVTGYNVGVALSALPAAMLMANIGRRKGFMAGMTVGFAGMMLAAWSILQGSFWGFCLSLLLVGCGGAFTQQFRFAASDQGTPDFKPKAISWVLAGGVVAAVVGPQTAIWFRDLFAPVEFAGAYFAGSFLLLICIFVLSFLRFEKPMSRAERKASDTGRPLSQIMAQPRFIVAVICAVASYALMSFVMTGAPIAMVACGFSPDHAANGIMLHVIAMFGPSFFTGNLIARYGVDRIVAIGMGLLLVCAVVALSGITLAHFWIALVLLGLGWNFGFIGATAMLTETYRPEEKAKAQGANDFILFSSVALASLMSGKTLNAFGWDAINWIVFPVVSVCLLSLLWWQTKKPAKA